MNSSVSPLIPPGSSLSGSLPSSASSSSTCAKWTDGRLFGKWLVTLKFPQGEEASSPWFGWTIGSLGFWSFGTTLLNLPSQPHWQPLGNLNMFSSVDLASGRLPLLLIAWAVCHRSDPSSALLHDLGENGQGRKLLILTNALKDANCPSLTWFPYQPSIIGIVLDSAHQALSHCYNVHSKSSACCLRLCQYQSSIPTLQDNLGKDLIA